jgi:hypothetical protein
MALVLTSLVVTMLSDPLNLTQICGPGGPAGVEPLQVVPSHHAAQGDRRLAPTRQRTSKKASDDIPDNYKTLYMAAATHIPPDIYSYHVPWEVLAAIGKRETNHGRYQGDRVGADGVTENYYGAGGPMQFIPGTWRSYGIDGNGDGKVDRGNPADAIYSTANYLIHLGASHDLRHALNSYGGDPSGRYADAVLAQAQRYHRGDYGVAPANYAGQSCTLPVPTGPLGQRIAAVAARFAAPEAGKPHVPNQVKRPIPYSWGGGDPASTTSGKITRDGIFDVIDDGPSFGQPQEGGPSGVHVYGFDCSGLARYAVWIATGKKILFDHITTAMFNSNQVTKVSRSQLAPGDLVFFEKNLGHMGIYYGTFNGRRWIVQAPKSGDVVKFSDFDSVASYLGYSGARRVTPSARA